MSYNESLKPNSNYPKMSQSEWDNAPWNEPIIPERDFDVDVEFVMRKKVKVTTNDYAPEFDEESGHTYANTEHTDWRSAYDDSGHFTIGELLLELESYIFEDLKRYKGNNEREKYLNRMLESCRDWDIESRFDEV